jgi:hypothetical protein
MLSVDVFLRAVARGSLPVTLAVLACSSEETPGVAPARGKGADAGGEATTAGVDWKTVFSGLPGALFSVWGRNEHDVWVVGSDANDGHGPLVLHYDGSRWLRMAASPAGDLWWVHGFDGGPVFMGGSNGTIVRFDSGRFTRIAAPRTAGTVFGIWGASASDVWAVGGDVIYGTGAFVWRLVGDRFEDVGQLPIPGTDVIAYFKVWGTGRDDVWFVGTPGLSMHYDGVHLERVDPGVPDPLFTVHARPARDLYAAVGGADLGVLVERNEGTAWSSAAVPSGTRTLFGVWLTAEGGYAVGDKGTVLSRAGGAWANERTGIVLDKGLHSVWVDPALGVWAAGGDILTPPYRAGVLIHKGKDVPGSYAVDTMIRDASAYSDASRSESGSDAAFKPAEAGDARGDVVLDAPDGQRDTRDAERDAPASRDARPETGPPPKTVNCGTSTCTLPNEICCADPNTGVPIGCAPSGTPCPGGQARVSCDEPSDCPSGFGCCLNREAQVGPLQNVECEPSCFGPSVCKTIADCNGDPCSVFNIMPSYMICPPPPP